ncbi:hypothetical protein Deba_0085 [Desulfarculus baarsii DSM 2075]|uniref:Uncharacterized protein n=1 Tax=Desulfarculus baarsii (strain ATCC 33931 / DSM 2075 / LMG 7858 / VKM B-1802 / 2st14) TaxID=644282 RepID=E1QDE5_DESB2|nr:hypothetical protein Deba_0085 [Desulfarculus baarsii DSM 2075]
MILSACFSKTTAAAFVLALLAVLAAGPGRAVAAQVVYDGVLSCGDMSTVVRFVYDDQAKTVSEFELVDACSVRAGAILFGGERAEARAAASGVWRLAATMAVGPDGFFAYSDEKGNHLNGRIGGKPWSVPCVGGVATYLAHGAVGRPKAKLVDCGRGQYYMPCARWAANPRP